MSYRLLGYICCPPRSPDGPYFYGLPGIGEDADALEIGSDIYVVVLGIGDI